MTRVSTHQTDGRRSRWALPRVSVNAWFCCNYLGQQIFYNGIWSLLPLYHVIHKKKPSVHNLINYVFIFKILWLVYMYSSIQETQQGWQTSAVALYLVVTLLLLHVRHLLPTSDIKHVLWLIQQLFRYALFCIYLFYRPQWTADVKAVNTVLLFDAASSGNSSE